MTETKQETVAKKETKQPEPSTSVREPFPGDVVVFTGWNKGEENLHAVVARTYGATLKVTLAYLTPSAQWQSAGPVPYEPTGTAGASWRWGSRR